MVTVVFLSIGTLMIQEGFLRAAGLYGRYANTLRAMLWADAKLWEGREGVQYAPSPEVAVQDGRFLSGGKSFSWHFETRQLGVNLFAVRVDVAWHEGDRDLHLTREAYAARPKTL